ncbi:MAG TPA: peptidase S53, partial [Ktedonobacteraceae bacterium]|nr:peptidase S53 [Ktedonobacteraceae bacterium]
CPVTIQYLLISGSPISRLVTVPPASRWTESVNGDLNTQASSQSYVADSAIVTVTGTTCTGVVAERPMYFANFSGVSSGSDVLGATHTGTSFSFADLSTLPNYNTFITILNPPSNTAPAHITAAYFLGGTQVGSDTLIVQPGTRGTINPQRLGKRVAAVVSSDQAVVVERPTYFNSFSPGNAHNVAGAASVVGAPAASSDWRFAEGFLGSGFQEYLALANFGSAAASTIVLLEYDNGSTLSVPVTVNAESQSIVDVNAVTASKQGTCSPQPCVLSGTVSAEITTSVSTPIVAEREMFFHYGHSANGRILGAMGGTDITGQSGAATATAYNFAEGYTNVGYNEWLTLQNPTGSTETIDVTLVNEMGNSYTFTVMVGAHTRGTVDITGEVIQHLYQPNDGFKGYEVSMSVQSNSGPFVAERPMYWNASGTQGGSDVLGYIGG